MIFQYRAPATFDGQRGTLLLLPNDDLPQV